MNATKILVAVLTLVVVNSRSALAGPPLADALKAAQRGPQKTVKLYDHEFAVKQADINRYPGKLVIKGQLSHKVKLRGDDQIYYEITKAGGKVGINVTRDKKVSTWGFVYSGVKTVGQAHGSGLSTKPRSWEAAAREIIEHIALNVN